MKVLISWLFVAGSGTPDTAHCLLPGASPALRSFQFCPKMSLETLQYTARMSKPYRRGTPLWWNLLGMAMDQAMEQILRDHHHQEHQQPGEWRCYDVDEYRLSINRDSMGNLEVQREETNDES